jgi:hypothetical protein
VSNVFFETYVQTTACLFYIRSAAGVTFYVINPPFIMERNFVILGVFDDIGYSISESESYSEVCAFAYVCDMVYLWGNICECCPPFVFVLACV